MLMASSFDLVHLPMLTSTIHPLQMHTSDITSANTTRTKEQHDNMNENTHTRAGLEGLVNKVPIGLNMTSELYAYLMRVTREPQVSRPRSYPSRPSRPSYPSCPSCPSPPSCPWLGTALETARSML